MEVNPCREFLEGKRGARRGEKGAFGYGSSEGSWLRLITPSLCFVCSFPNVVLVGISIVTLYP